MIDDDEVGIQVQCPECELWFDPDNEHDNGLISHVLEKHPLSHMAKQVDEVLLERLLEDDDGPVCLCAYEPTPATCPRHGVLGKE